MDATPNTVTLHRVIKTTPDKLFRAFSNPTAYATWIPPYGFYCKILEFDFRVGGSYKASFTNFTTNKEESFGGKIVELKENEFIKYTDSFDNANLPGTMLTSVWIKPVIGGTELRIVQEGIPSVIPVEMCYLGWQDSLDKLMRLVEPEIKDG